MPMNWRGVVLFGLIYAAVGIWFPNPPVPGSMQFAWRLAAWAICLVAFTTHIGLEHFRWQSPTRGTAVRAAAAVALGAFALAVAANIHARTAGRGNTRLLMLSLAIWPIMTGLPAFVVAIAVAAGLAGFRRKASGDGS